MARRARCWRIPSSSPPILGARWPMLELRDLTCGYGRMPVVRNLNLTVGDGEILTLLGANGAGKTSSLMAIAGHVEIQAGAVSFLGEDITRLSAVRRATRRIALSPEGRRLFKDLTVRENLIVGGYRLREKRLRANIDRVLALFPRLRERLHNLAGTLSGGEQQMVAIGRALMSEPRLLLIDEISLGLMPKNVDICYAAIRELRQADLAIILVDQNTERALDLADKVVVLES